MCHIVINAPAKKHPCTQLQFFSIFKKQFFYKDVFFQRVWTWFQYQEEVKNIAKAFIKLGLDRYVTSQILDLLLIMQLEVVVNDDNEICYAKI